MVLTEHNKHIIVFKEEGFQLPMPSKCWEIIENANIVLHFLQQIQDDGLAYTKQEAITIKKKLWHISICFLSTHILMKYSDFVCLSNIEQCLMVGYQNPQFTTNHCEVI